MIRATTTNYTRTFRLVRHDDVSGVSGTGVVAEGVQWSDGQVAIHWLGEWVSTSIWPGIDIALAVHGHQGATVVEWDQPDWDDIP